MSGETRKIWGVCRACGDLVYREPGKRYKNGQVDSDSTPVWLLDTSASDANALSARRDNLAADGISVPLVFCGCGGRICNSIEEKIKEIRIVALINLVFMFIAISTIILISILAIKDKSALQSKVTTSQQSEIQEMTEDTK